MTDERHEKKDAGLSLNPANNNDWYWLATLYNVETDEAINEIIEKNRTSWNRWFAATLSNEQRDTFLKIGIPELELTPFTPEEKSEVEATYARRSNYRSEKPPSPDIQVNFDRTHFQNDIFLSGFLFVTSASFSEAKFSGYTDFNGAVFADGTNFKKATFSDNSDFNKAKFFGHAYFSETTFSMDAGFQNATFTKLANFMNANFIGFANFTGVTFSEVATFVRAKFSYPHFIDATFSEFANFSWATFEGTVDFKGATFSKDAEFLNAKFGSKTIFAGARFESSVPVFHGATLHEATQWHKVIWPPVPESEQACQDQIYAYERLRQEMERLKKPDDEHFFVRKEFRAKRGLVKLWSGEWLLNCSYAFLSDYGHSIVRPIIGMLVLFLFGVLVLFLGGISVFCPPPVLAGTSMTIWHAAAISFANIFSIFPGAGKIMLAEHPVILSGALRLFAVTQFIFGALLIFLLGLALRNRFRMK